MRKIRKGASVCIRSNLILFVVVLVLVLEIGILWGTMDEYEDDDEDEVCSCRAVSPGFHIVSQKVTGVRNGDRGLGRTA